MSNGTKNKKNKKGLGLKDVIIVTLFSVLTFVVSMITAIPFAGSVMLQLYAGYALMAIISGPIYVLMISKSSKIGTQILFLGIKALYFLLMGQVLTGVIFPVIILGDTYAQGLIEKGYAVETVNTMVNTYKNPVIVITVILMLIVTSSIGMFVGYKLMKKHFAPAGIVEAA
ncbi:MAG: MptD family putative ECF transporter S component [Eubacterium sp.]|nr:MptD family putative ECF transporter S component [Eubacterium sp.]